MDAGRYLHSWLDAHPDIENSQGLKIFTPLGPWMTGSHAEESYRIEMVGQLMRQNTLVTTGDSSLVCLGCLSKLTGVREGAKASAC